MLGKDAELKIKELKNHIRKILLIVTSMWIYYERHQMKTNHVKIMCILYGI